MYHVLQKILLFFKWLFVKSTTSLILGELDKALFLNTLSQGVLCVFTGKPKIEPIVWETGAQIKTQTGHTGQAFRSRPPRRGQPPYQGHAQQRGRGQFQRGRSPVARTTRGGSRGSRGGMFRSPNMF